MNNEITPTPNNLPASLNDKIATLLQKAVGMYVANYQILIQNETRQVKAAWLTQWLKDNLKVQGAEASGLIALTFIGKKQSPLGQNYNAYSLIVDKG